MFEGALHGHQPFEGVEADLKRLRVVGFHADGDQGMRQSGVVVAQDLLEPRPFRRGGLLVELDEPIRQLVADLADETVAAEAPEIFMDAQQTERPGARRGHFRYGL